MLSACSFSATRAIMRTGRLRLDMYKYMSAATRCHIENTTINGTHLDLAFTDGSAFRFHALWLRDACRDSVYVAAEAGERVLSLTPVVAGCPDNLSVKVAAVGPDGRLHVGWSDASMDGTFDPGFLRQYADSVAKPLLTAQPGTDGAEMNWLKPYSGYPGTRAPSPDQLDLWRSPEGFAVHRFNFKDIITTPRVNLELMRVLARHGAAVVQDIPEVHDASTLLDFASTCFGGMQKDPARQEPNWKITKKADAKSISYNQDLRLNNHTDQSVPPHGIPGVLLLIHYIDGEGTNTLCDGFAVAEALRSEDPEAFSLLSTYGVDAERDFCASRVDAQGNHNQSLLVKTRYPILQTDQSGEVMRIQYNEVFRTPLNLPYEVFRPWYKAFRKFVDMCHSSQFERHIKMQAGQMLVLQNWRVLHGRAGHQSPNRTLVGGTVTRESFYSHASQLMQL